MARPFQGRDDLLEVLEDPNVVDALMPIIVFD
jgi:hypothetical protein